MNDMLYHIAKISYSKYQTQNENNNTYALQMFKQHHIQYLLMC